MLCRRCNTLLRGIRPIVAPTTATRRPASSYPLQRRAACAPTPTVPLATRFSTRRTSLTKPAQTAKVSSSSALLRPIAPPAESKPSSSTLEKPDFLDDAESMIWDRLVEDFSPVELVVQDISGGCGSMYGIEISSEKFHGANMLKQQRMVNAVLGDMMKNWHGVQLKTRIP